MDRVKTFATYVILIFGFFGLSILLENLALRGMYKNISCEFDSSYNDSADSFKIENVNASACNINGYIEFDLTNTSERTIDKCYAKVDLFNKQGLLAKTDYIEVLDLKPGETRNFKIKFKANNIERFAVSVVESIPDKANIINILGWEIDLSNIFDTGIDLTEMTIFGTKITDLFGGKVDIDKDGIVDTVKEKGKYLWNWLMVNLKAVPWWAYGIGWCMIIGAL